MRKPPEILETRVACESRIFRIEQLDLAFSNGANATFERVCSAGGLPGNGAVLIVAMPDPETVLLIREWGAGSKRYELGFPKGRVEQGEPLLESATREIMEEVGYGAKDLHHLRTLSVAPGYIQSQTYIVLARDLYPQRHDGDEPEPLDVTRWPIADIAGLLDHPEFNDARSVASLFLTQRFLHDENA